MYALLLPKLVREEVSILVVVAASDCCWRRTTVVVLVPVVLVGGATAMIMMHKQEQAFCSQAGVVLALTLDKWIQDETLSRVAK
jgi:hypothetical protein